MIEAKVTKILNHENLYIVKFLAQNQTLTMVSLELSKKVKVGASVQLQVKSSHVAIGKNLQNMQVSYANALHCHVVSLKSGELLSVAKLKISEDLYLESIITNESCQRLKLKQDDEVVAFIKASELSILRIL